MKAKLCIAMASIFVCVFSCVTPALCAVVSTRVCLTSLVETDVVTPDLPPIKVGCEAIDCCKGCPGPPFAIEWQITVEGDGVAGAVFDFDKLQRSAPSGLKPRSGARQIEQRSADSRARQIDHQRLRDGWQAINRDYRETIASYESGSGRCHAQESSVLSQGRSRR
jgi:hypothetical protein